jgi:hypothetical protein
MSTPGGESRYTSNEWLVPIAGEAMPIFSQFPQETAIEVAAAVLKSKDTGATEIPWATVFPSDDKTQVASRLARVLTTPDYSTPAYDVDTHLAVEELRGLLDRHHAVGLQGKHAAYYLVQTAAGKEDEPFLTYQDTSRKWPQYATDWFGKLEEQFGKGGYEEIRSIHPEFAILLGSTAAAAELHYQQRQSMQQPGESSVDLIQRVAQFFDLSSIDGLIEANKVLEHGLEGYRKAAYHIRGLPEPND